MFSCTKSLLLFPTVGLNLPLWLWAGKRSPSIQVKSFLNYEYDEYESFIHLSIFQMFGAHGKTILLVGCQHNDLRNKYNLADCVVSTDVTPCDWKAIFPYTYIYIYRIMHIYMFYILRQCPDLTHELLPGSSIIFIDLHRMHLVLLILSCFFGVSV